MHRNTWSIGGLQQRLFIVLAALLLCAPLIAQVAGLSPPRPDENRALAPIPALPSGFSALAGWTQAMDAYVKDHFGLRGLLVNLNDRLLFRVFGAFASPQVMLGRDGRVFLTSHGAGEATRNNLIQQSCGFAISEAVLSAASASMEEFLLRSANALRGAHPGLHPDVRVVSVPTSASLYTEVLPRWLARQCATSTPPGRALIDRLNPALRSRFIDTTAIMRDVEREAPAIPRRNFHWDGIAPVRVAEFLAEEVLRRPRALTLSGRNITRRSDISQFFPGVSLTDTVFSPDYGAAGVTPCLGAPCFPALGDVGPILQDMRRYTGPAPDGRLLLITDSFGAIVAGAFSQQFQEVWQISINNFTRLDPEQRAKLRQVLLEEYRPDTMLMLFHDATAFGAGGLLKAVFYPD
ncbi:hypothetical protein ACQW02_11535 [Humitalea sp. 24SJ18S-53]|uniref:hypothetical protein n=1 Tax=Humitalea sp. 24SJ18S-53 TaxID=3422307 RepID=UPI003D66F9E2